MKIAENVEAHEDPMLVTPRIMRIRNPFYKVFRKQINTVLQIVADTSLIKSKQMARRVLKFTKMLKYILRPVMDTSLLNRLNNIVYHRLRL